jgi:hypothetical protein
MAEPLLALLACATCFVQDAAQARLPGDPLARAESGLRERMALTDPRLDGWRSEAAYETTGRILALLAEALAVPAAPTAEELAPLLAEGFACSALRPQALARVDPTLEVEVWRPARTDERRFDGAEGLTRALAELREALGGNGTAKFKTVEVAEREGAASTRALLLADRAGPAARQVNALWAFEWRIDPAGRAELLAVESLQHEEVRAPRELLTDVTGAVFGTDPCFAAQLLFGEDAWRARLDASLGLPLMGHASGIAIGDVDLDGLEDVYVAQPGGLPNRLFLHQGDHTALDRASAWGVDFLDLARGVLLVDLDGDVDLDLALGMPPELLLLENTGARFVERVALAVDDVTSLAAADVDLDGDVDVYACAYSNPYDGGALPLPYHDANNGQRNVLARNQGGWRFVDATEALGLDANNRRFSFAAAFEDYDDDGDLDLYVANDFGRNNLYRNDGGRFEDVAAQAGVEDVSAGMGVTWGDYDGDGRLDLYVSNMFSSAGQRVTYQRRFRPSSDEATRALYQRHARGNSLFHNEGDGTFTDVSASAGVSMGRWAWGGLFVDLNDDAAPDIVVPNGFYTGERADDL